jgi:hypothetical protein
MTPGSRKGSRKMFNRSLSISYVDTKLKFLETERKRESRTLELLVLVAQRPAVLVQSVLRMFMARSEYKQHLSNMGKPPPVLYRTIKRSQESLENHAASKIQALYRGVYTRVLLFQERPFRSAFYKLQRATRSQVEKDRDYHRERLRRKAKAGLNNVFVDIRDSRGGDSQVLTVNNMNMTRHNDVKARLIDIDLHQSSIEDTVISFCDILAKRTPTWCHQNSSNLSPKTNARFSIPEKAVRTLRDGQVSEGLTSINRDGMKKRIIHHFFSGDESDTDSEVSEYVILHRNGNQKEGLIAQRQRHLRPRLVRHLADQSDDETD